MLATRSLVMVALAVLCSCGPSINKKVNNANRALFDQAAGGTAHDPGVAGQQPVLQPGQWAKYAIRYENTWQVQKVSVVGAEGGSVWLEMETIDPKADNNPSWVKVQINGYDPGDPHSIATMEMGDIYVLNKRGEQATKAVIPFGNPWDFIVANMKLSLSEGSPEDAASPAGTFPACNRVEGKFEMMGFSTESTVWFHSAVPVWGYVQQKTKDGKYEARLLEYGMEGADSVVDHENANKPLG